MQVCNYIPIRHTLDFHYHRLEIKVLSYLDWEDFPDVTYRKHINQYLAFFVCQCLILINYSYKTANVVHPKFDGLLFLNSNKMESCAVIVQLSLDIYSRALHYSYHILHVYNHDYVLFCCVTVSFVP